MTVYANAPRRAPRLKTAMSIAALAAGLIFTTGFGGTAAMAEKSVVTCQTTKVKVVVSDTYRSTTSTTFAPLPEAGGQFVQKGSKPGCVMIRFEAYAATVSGAVMTISATIDGKTIAPDTLQLTNAPLYLPAAWTFIVPDVAPGKHNFAFQFRTNNSSNFVAVNRTTTIVHFGG